MIKTIVGVCGYVESARMSYLFFSHAEGFETRHEALTDMAHGLLKLYDDPGQYTPKCCSKSTTKHCPECGRRVKRGIDFEKFHYWLDGLHSETADSIGDIENCLDWWPWMAIDQLFDNGKESVLYLAEKFSEWILFALDSSRLEEDDRQALEKFRKITSAPWYSKETIEEELKKETYGTRGPR